jgi:regulator of replication initiation timing
MSAIFGEFDELELKISDLLGQIEGLHGQIESKTKLRQTLTTYRAKLIKDLYEQVIEPAAKETGYQVMVDTSKFNSHASSMPFEQFYDHWAQSYVINNFDSAYPDNSLSFVLYQDNKPEKHIKVTFSPKYPANQKKPTIEVIPIPSGRSYEHFAEQLDRTASWLVDLTSPKDSLVKLIQRYETEILPTLKGR